MKPRKLLILFLIILFTVLQCTALNYIQIFKIKPDILLVLLSFFSLYYGRIYGLAVGAICGLAAEATSAVPSGSVVFIYSLAGLALGHIGRLVYNERIFGQIAVSFISTFVIYFFLFLFFHSFSLSLPLFNTLTTIIFPASFYTASLSPILFRFLKIVLAIR